MCSIVICANNQKTKNKKPPINDFKTKKDRDEVAGVITSEFLPENETMRRKITQVFHHRYCPITPLRQAAQLSTHPPGTAIYTSDTTECSN